MGAIDNRQIQRLVNPRRFGRMLLNLTTLNHRFFRHVRNPPWSSPQIAAGIRAEGREIVQRNPLPGEADPKLLPRVRRVDDNWLEVTDNVSFDLMQGRVRGPAALIDMLRPPMSSCEKRISTFNLRWPLQQHLDWDLVRLDTPPRGRPSTQRAIAYTHSRTGSPGR
jgi:hypothetical protein